MISMVLMLIGLSAVWGWLLSCCRDGFTCIITILLGLMVLFFTEELITRLDVLIKLAGSVI